VLKQLLAFQQAGITISLDDFGTGYSSLSYLRKFSLDFLKIDKSFVYNLEYDAANVALCEAIIVMAHKLGLRVVAEGVETRQQADILHRAGCDFAQGFLFGHAVPAQQFEEMLTAQRLL
jgi:sensor c-di-GMP phosphodiesterase-like protein